MIKTWIKKNLPAILMVSGVTIMIGLQIFARISGIDSQSGYIYVLVAISASCLLVPGGILLGIRVRKKHPKAGARTIAAFIFFGVLSFISIFTNQ